MQYERFANYELTFAALAASTGSSQQSFQVESNYDFWWIKAEAYVYDSAGLGVSRLQWPNLEVLISEGASNQQLMNQAVSLNSIFGSGEIPYILPRPHTIQGGSTLTATVYNKHATIAYSARLCFSGVLKLRGGPVMGAVEASTFRRRRAG